MNEIKKTAGNSPAVFCYINYLVSIIIKTINNKIVISNSKKLG